MRHSPRLRRDPAVLTALAVAVLGAACTTTARNPFDGPAPGDTPVRVEVDNGLTLDVAVYAIRGGSRFRIGDIPSLSRRTLALPRSLIAPGQAMRLQADPVGSRERYHTQTLYLADGALVAWSIIPGLQSSQASVRR